VLTYQEHDMKYTKKQIKSGYTASAYLMVWISNWDAEHYLYSVRSRIKATMLFKISGSFHDIKSSRLVSQYRSTLVVYCGSTRLGPKLIAAYSDFDSWRHMSGRDVQICTDCVFSTIAYLLVLLLFPSLKLVQHTQLQIVLLRVLTSDISSILI
jgi:hypothetical protein